MVMYMERYKRIRDLREDHDLTQRAVGEAIKHGIAYVSEDRKMLGLNLLDDIKTATVQAKWSKVTHNGVIDWHEVFVAAGSLVAPGKRLESGWLYRGSPAVAARH